VRVEVFTDRGKAVDVYDVRVLPEETAPALHAFMSSPDNVRDLPYAACWFYPELSEFALVNFGALRQPPAWAFMKPIVLHGGEHDGRKVQARYCGSALKSTGTLVAMFGDHDPIVDAWGLLRDANRAVYTGPWFQSGISAILRDAKVFYTDWSTGLDRRTGRRRKPVFVGKETKTPYYVGEGTILMTKSAIAEILKHSTAAKFDLDRQARATYLLDSLLSDENEFLFEELIPGLQRGIDMANNPALMTMAVIEEDSFRAKLLEHCPGLDGDAGKHPYIAHHIVARHAEFVRRAATSHRYQDATTRVAIPSPNGEVVLSGKNVDERFKDIVLVRQPSISPNAAMAVHATVDGPWRKWIEELVVVQIRLLSRDIFIKGLVIVVPDGDLGEYDIVTAGDNVKLSPEPLHRARRKRVAVHSELFCLVTQVYKPGMAIAVPASLMARMEGDFDGDLVQVIPCSGQYGEFWKEVYSFPRWDTAKAAKEPWWIVKKKGIDMRPAVMREHRAQLMGQAVNEASHVATLDQGRLKALADALGLREPKLINEDYPQWMSPTPRKWRPLAALAWVAWLAQMATDTPKAAAWGESVREGVGAIRTIRTNNFDGWEATFASAKRNNWFSLGLDIPEIKPEWRGMIYKIMRHVVPHIKWMKLDPVAPLSHFAIWVPFPDEGLAKAVGSFYRMFCMRVKRVNVEDTQPGGALDLFKREAKRLCERAFVQWAAQNAAVHFPKCPERVQLRSELFTDEVFMGIDSCRAAVADLGAQMVEKRGAPQGMVDALLRKLGPENELVWAQAIWWRAHYDVEREDKRIKYHGTMPFWCLREEMLLKVLEPKRTAFHASRRKAPTIPIIGVQYAVPEGLPDGEMEIKLARRLITRDGNKLARRRVVVTAEGLVTRSAGQFDGTAGVVPLNHAVPESMIGVPLRVRAARTGRGAYDLHVQEGSDGNDG
jgi:hypothetical protein